ncbi:MAG TPA: SRPBCC family protein, partial [Stenomitos sp.]
MGRAAGRMCRWGAMGGMLALLVPAQAVRAEDGFGPLTAADQDRIDRGEIVVQVEKTSDALKSFRAVGQVKAPAERVYAAVTDFEHYADLFKIKEARVVNRQGSHLWVHAVIGLPWPVGDRWVTNETVLMPESTMFAYQRR